MNKLNGCQVEIEAEKHVEKEFKITKMMRRMEELLNKNDVTMRSGCLTRYILAMPIFNPRRFFFLMLFFTLVPFLSVE